ncbi:sulfite exporter TauE/SafE family protein [Phreatobacter stygius]|uniref:Probable membrane transporter protein n=1 Tax=Phreatobacter stygius TaxID=1940610 RepID=A0A4D7B807_9HYPH|nr:sulfite exporter TauE/SafE family protein [Phreatobacter stygius]QCI66540.1 sulfite exporter TauE/SafE family protein [Phreatobacter stygius]
MEFIVVLAVGLVAGTISGIIGTGSTIMLAPVLAYCFGPQEAVPIMAVASILANVSRILAWWREVDWRAFAAYAVTGAPAAALGARTLIAIPPRAADIAIGLFLIAMIPLRRWFAARQFRFTLWHLGLAGAVIGYLTGIVIATGPISVPVFVSYGLVGGAFLGTESAGSLAIYAAKVLSFRQFGALPVEIVLKGLITGSSLMAGAFVAKRFVLSMDAAHFRVMLDGLMLVSGLAMLWTAWGH